MLRRKSFYVIYPEYFDKSLSRSEGRKVSLKVAAEEPSIKKIAYACKELGLEYKLEPDKAHPARWWEQNGRVLIPIDKQNKVPKRKIVLKISDIVRRLVKKKKVVKKGKRKDKGSSRTPPVR